MCVGLPITQPTGVKRIPHSYRIDGVKNENPLYALITPSQLPPPPPLHTHTHAPVLLPTEYLLSPYTIWNAWLAVCCCPCTSLRVSVARERSSSSAQRHGGDGLGGHVVSAAAGEQRLRAYVNDSLRKSSNTSWARRHRAAGADAQPEYAQPHLREQVQPVVEASQPCVAGRRGDALGSGGLRPVVEARATTPAGAIRPPRLAVCARAAPSVAATARKGRTQPCASG